MSLLTTFYDVAPATLDAARAALFQNSGWILAAMSGGALLSDLALSRLRDRDPRTEFLARFLDIPEDHIIPLPPTTALWCLYAQRNREADVDIELPNGSQTLQGSYLVMTARGAALVAVHNFETPIFYHAPDQDDDLVDTVGGHLSVGHGLITPESFPVEIEFDAARRADLTTYILKSVFRTPGDVVPMTLLRDAQGNAPAAVDEPSQAGHAVQRLSFGDPQDARLAIDRLDGGAQISDPRATRDWFLRWPGKVTSLRRRAWRTGLLLAGLGFGAWQSGLVA